jgi:hypothetical protein
MKVIITEEQLSVYVRRRYHCMKDYLDKLASGEERLFIPPGDFEWSSYQVVFTAVLRLNCDDKYNGLYSQDIHNEVMELFGDDMFKIYKENK